MGLGNRINDYADRNPRRFAILSLTLFLLPIFIGFAVAFVWAVTEFFADEPSYDYFFWLAILIGGIGGFAVGASMWDLWRRRIKTPRPQIGQD